MPYLWSRRGKRNRPCRYSWTAPPRPDSESSRPPPTARVPAALPPSLPPQSRSRRALGLDDAVPEPPPSSSPPPRLVTPGSPSLSVARPVGSLAQHADAHKGTPRHHPLQPPLELVALLDSHAPLLPSVVSRRRFISYLRVSRTAADAYLCALSLAPLVRPHSAQPTRSSSSPSRTGSRASRSTRA